MRFLLISFFVILFNSGYGQLNLVPNPSFEDFDSCPDQEGQITRAIGWENFGVYNSTPDYYNACDTGQWNVPNGLGIKQTAHTGNAFAAVVTFFINNNYREYMGIELFQPLIIGTKYYISFYTSLGELFGLNCPSNNIGIKLTTVHHSTSNPVSFSNNAQLKSDSIIADTINWTYLYGTFVSDSAYNYLIIGNFYDNFNTDTLNWSSTAYSGYYGVDDICLSTDSNACKNSTSLKDIKENEIKIFPNPTTGLINIQPDNKIRIEEVLVYNQLGVLVETKKTLLNNSIVIHDSPGMYYLKIITKNKCLIIPVIKL